MSSTSELPTKFKTLSNELVTALKGHDSQEKDEIVREARRLVQQLQKPADYATRMLWAPVELATAAAACELGIFSAITHCPTPTTLKEITQSSKTTDDLLTQRIVQSLAAHGMIDQLSTSTYQANPITLDLNTPGRTGGVMTMMLSMRAWSTLPWFLRENGYKAPTDLKNCCWQKAFPEDTTMWSWMKANPEMGKYFNDYMGAPRPHTSAELVEIYPFGELFKGSTPGDVVFVDVGGGFGQQCLNLRKVFSKEWGRVILQDLPHVVEGKELRDIEVMEHDMMTEQPVKGAKAYYFRGVLHDHDDEVCKKFLQQTVKAMNADSRLLVHDSIIEDFMPTIQSVRQDLGLMCLMAGRERTKAQMKALLESVGLKVVGTYKPGPDAWSITEARL